MLDSSCLSDFVQSQHLQAQSLQGYHQAFKSHPLRLVVLRSFLSDSVVEQIGQFLAKEVVFRQAYALNVSVGEVAREEWHRASDQSRLYTFGALDAISPEFTFSPNGILFLKLVKALRNLEFKSCLEAVSGLVLDPEPEIRLNGLKQGDFIRPHSDMAGRRRLAFLIYLSADWVPSFGGALEVVAHDKSTTRIEANYNSLLIFDIARHKGHHVTPIESSAGLRRRVSLAGWFGSDGRAM